MYYSASLSPVYRRPTSKGKGGRYLFTPAEFMERQKELPLKTVAILFARKNSIYRGIDLADIWDEQRDARLFSHDLPVVAHPPCRGWGRLRQFAKVRPHELELAHFAVSAVQRCGGVLEHPAHSKLWFDAGLPLPGCRDQFGGFTYPIYQSWFGHRAPKPTWLYIVGHDMHTLPPIPFELGIPSGRIELMGKPEREATPVDLANWLFRVAETARFSTCSASTTASNSAKPEFHL